MAKRTTKTEPADPQDIQELNERYNKLNTRKIQAETNLKNAKKQLDDLRKKAKKDFGTDDLDELQSMLEKLRNENKEKQAVYQASLDEIEKKLSEIDPDHGSSANVKIDEELDG